MGASNLEGGGFRGSCYFHGQFCNNQPFNLIPLMESTAILIREARRILNGETFDETKIKELAKKLKDCGVFGVSR